jgi:hypothetical protein
MLLQMAPWIWPVLVFSAAIFWAAASRRMFGLAAGLVLYAVAAAALATADAPALRFTGPLLILVLGYWLTGPFYTSPSPRLEEWLIRYDDMLRVDAFVARSPAAFRALIDLVYQGCYPFMVIAAVPAFMASRPAFESYWTIVLAAELACYVTLPWLQARPPWKRGGGQVCFPENRPGALNSLRRFNEYFLDRLSVRATTIPSGHVAGPIAASIAVWMIAPAWGPWLLAGALAIAAATVLGRYHYAVDGVLGVATGIVPPAVKAFWL